MPNANPVSPVRGSPNVTSAATGSPWFMSRSYLQCGVGHAGPMMGGGSGRKHTHAPIAAIAAPSECPDMIRLE